MSDEQGACREAYDKYLGLRAADRAIQVTDLAWEIWREGWRAGHEERIARLERELAKLRAETLGDERLGVKILDKAKRRRGGDSEG